MVTKNSKKVKWHREEQNARRKVLSKGGKNQLVSTESPKWPANTTAITAKRAKKPAGRGTVNDSLLVRAISFLGKKKVSARKKGSLKKGELGQNGREANWKARVLKQTPG